MAQGTGGIVACSTCGAKNRVPPAAVGVPRCARCHTPLEWVVDAVDTSFVEVVDRAQLPVLVDLWAPWCGPCRAVSPVLERLAAARAGRVKLVRVNVEEAPEVAGRFQASAIPTLLVMARGHVLSRRTGAAPEAELGAWLDDALQRASGEGSDGRHGT